ncbi:hypothetical protein KZ483_01945 [Paenibacillus sp. sptzw28]|uniref:hypothetical protein n=1 Tax=Paenibacillus sp. sptzw28 TaxID=715179 RepID=UPI001C6E7C39|nr:hypothetical protein [Paenibacillus sp. sptzw28]QYR21830.1 hypothetical protein KZ483_01945 [Paenibacillus sp. sptzw28]
MAERSILAYFNSPDQAEDALSKLKSLRIIESSIDRIDGYPGDGIDHIDNPITSDFPGLGYLTLGGDFSDRDASILAAASVSASGMSSGGTENRVTGRDILLTVVLQEEDYEQAMQAVRDAGALL